MGQLSTKVSAAQMQQVMGQARPQDGIQAMLRERWPQIQSVMPKHMSSERLFQIAVSAINHTPELLEATPETILSCVMKCSALGLEPSAVDGLGKAYILPFRNHGRMEAQFIIGYRGIIDLARRSGELKSIHAQAVYVGDDFECWEDETGQHFTFRPGRDNPHVPQNLTDVYVCAQLKDGGMVFERMTKAEVDSIKARSRASKSGPWVTDYEAMALKTVIRRSARYLPMSAQAQEAIAADETTPNYDGVLRPVIEVGEATVEDVPPESKQRRELTDEEKAELRDLTAKCVAIGANEAEAKKALFAQWQQGGMGAARDYAKAAEDDAAIERAIAECVDAGYDADETRRWLVGLRKSNGVERAVAEAARIVAEAGSAPDGVDPATGEVTDVADEDIEF